MKLLYLADLYPAYVREFYGTRPLLELESYEHQLACLQAHGFAWNGAWQPALAPLGYEVMDVYPNAEPLQRTWAWQYDRRLLRPADLRRIAVEQVRRFAPEVVLFDQYDEVLLDAIRAEVPGVRLIVGWVGGTLPDTNIWSKLDLVLSCAPESVEALRALGAHAEHMHHGFNHTLLPRIRSGARTVDVGFFGQIVTSGSFHRERERFFERLVAAGIPLELYSPSADFGLRDDWIWLLRLGAWGAARTLKAARVPDGAIGRIPLVRRAARWSHRPSMPVSRTLKPHLRPALYGIDMLQAISESRVTLNVHADTSIRYASNMRLFETTGVGSCLLTDWRDNIPELFTPDKEIVAYRSPEECVERIRWLLGHPAEAEAIGRAAQARTLRDHTYARRAETLDAVIRRNLTMRTGANGSSESRENPSPRARGGAEARPPRHYCTLFDSNYLLRGLALYQSLVAHAGAFVLHVLCMDDTTFDLLQAMKLPGVRLIRRVDFEDPELLAVKPTRTVAEYCWTCSPCLPLYVLEHDPAIDMITYLDADLYFFSSPEPIFEELGTKSILIVEHRFTQRFKHLEENGKYNVEWLTFRRDTTGMTALRWWREKCIEWCFYRLEKDRMGDQKYLDTWPERFPGVHVLQNIGAGVAPWNFAQYRIAPSSGRVLVDGVPLVFFHFHGFRMRASGTFTRMADIYLEDAVAPEAVYGPYEKALAEALKAVRRVRPDFDRGIEPVPQPGGVMGEPASRRLSRLIRAAYRRTLPYALRVKIRSVLGAHNWRSE